MPNSLFFSFLEKRSRLVGCLRGGVAGLAVTLLVTPAAAQSPASAARALPGLPVPGVDAQLAEDSTPKIQIWRSGQVAARVPQRVMRQKFAQVALDESDETILVRLAFPPALRGKVCQVLTHDGWSVGAGAGDEDAAPLEGATLRLRPNGRVSFLLHRTSGTRRGSVWVVVNGVKTELRFVVLSAENQARLRQSSPRLAESLGLH